jgi:hypothetical protein
MYFYTHCCEKETKPTISGWPYASLQLCLSPIFLTPKGRSLVFGPFLKFGQAIVDVYLSKKSPISSEHVV